MKTLKRILTTIMLLSLYIVTGLSQTQVVNAEQADTLIVHYKRYDGNELDYSMWLWPSNGNGSQYEFDGIDEYGAYAEIDLSTTNLTTDEIGIIVMEVMDNGTWIKDIDKDRYVSITSPNQAGEVHLYILTGVEFISYVSENQAGCNMDEPIPYLCAQDLTNGLIDAYFDASGNIIFEATSSFTASDITIEKDGVPVTFSGFSSGQTGTLILETTPDYTSEYTFSLDTGDEIQTIILRLNADYDSEAFQTMYNYDGTLGAIHTDTSTTFKVWAPVSSDATVSLYTSGHTTAVRSDGVNTPFATHQMTYLEKGVWSVTIDGDLHGVYYTFNVKNDGAWVYDVPDPYGVSYGVNGDRSMVVDFDQVNPEGWDDDQSVDGYESANDAIIYEIHVRDLTAQDTWNGREEYRYTYLGFTERGTTYTNPYNGVTVSTGLDHLIELGVTHIHLLPTHDFGATDETNPSYNWGYWTEHFNAPEGSYSTDPYDGSVRITEYKQMVMALHENGLNVIQDVVYNHTAGTNFSMNYIVPNYIYRLNSDGSYSNGTGVGNETATERYMWSKFIVDSTRFWAEEYNIDGFRFDLMAVHDYMNMNAVADAVEAVDPDNFVYGEPWGGGTIAIPYDDQAGKNNTWRMPLISVFNDNIRNTIKGSPDGSDSGYITNGNGIYDIMKGIEGSTNWGIGETSTQSVNYVSAHDNLTLFDKLNLVHGSTGYTEEIDYEARLANTIVMFSQGIPFLHAGVDFLRTKSGNSNSYDASDLINQLSWVRKTQYVDSFEYYKGIIEIRKEFDSFKMVTESDISDHLEFLYPDGYGLIGYRMTKNDEDILVYFNSGVQSNEVNLPSGAWELLVNQNDATLDGLGTYEGSYPIKEAETLLFVPGDPSNVGDAPAITPKITNNLPTIYEGNTFTVETDISVTAYSINGGDFEFVLPTTEIALTDLEPGQYTLRVKTARDMVSLPFTLTVLEKVVTTPDELTITSDTQTIFEGASFTLSGSDDFVAYKINDGNFVTVVERDERVFESLVVGTYTFVIKNADNLESDPFVLTVLENKPSITTDISAIDPDTELTITVNQMITSIKLDDLDFVSISETNEYKIGYLDLGEHTIVVRNSAGAESDPYVIQVTEEGVTCQANPNQPICETILADLNQDSMLILNLGIVGGLIVFGTLILILRKKHVF